MGLQPIYLFADSRLLFWRNKDGLFLESIRARMPHTDPRAAYVGASNGDDPQFYSIFEAAMDGIGIRDCRMILSSFSPVDQAFIRDADLILLAGGDVEKGWNVFVENGLRELIVERYAEGTLLIGVSAGAVQLGLFGLAEAEGSFNRLFDAFKLVPFIIGAHGESEAWKSLRETIHLLEGSATGIGIPAGGGMVYYPDGAIEALREPLSEFTARNGTISESLLISKR